jgi:hypothetical protein
MFYLELFDYYLNLCLIRIRLFSIIEYELGYLIYDEIVNKCIWHLLTT